MWSFTHIASLGLQVASLLWLISVWRRRASGIGFWNPLSIVALFFLVYFVVGPIVGILTNGSYFLGRDFTNLLPLGWLAGSLGVTAITIGYLLAARGVPHSSRSIGGPISVPSLTSFGYVLLLLGLAGTVAWIALGNIGLTIATIELGAEIAGAGEEAQRVNYLYHTVNFFIAATLIFLIGRGKLSASLLLLAIIAMALYAAIGFRYRIAIMLLGIIVAYYLLNRQRPSFSFIVVAILSSLVLMGALSTFRQYYSGIRLDGLGEVSLGGLLLNALSETNTFYAFCAVLDAVPQHIDFAYFDPLIYIFILPIPRFVWPEKPAPEYLQKVHESIGTAHAWYAGTAIPSLGEYYLAFGWVGIAVGALCFGLVIGWLWTKFLKRIDDPRWMVLYSLCFPFIYYALSRGYAAQLVQDFVFTLGPAFAAFVFCRARRPPKSGQLIASPVTQL